MVVMRDGPQLRRGPWAAQHWRPWFPLTEQELHLGVGRRALLETSGRSSEDKGRHFVLGKSHIK